MEEDPEADADGGRLQRCMLRLLKVQGPHGLSAQPALRNTYAACFQRCVALLPEPGRRVSLHGHIGLSAAAVGHDVLVHLRDRAGPKVALLRWTSPTVVKVFDGVDEWAPGPVALLTALDKAVDKSTLLSFTLGEAEENSTADLLGTVV